MLTCRDLGFLKALMTQERKAAATRATMRGDVAPSVEEAALIVVPAAQRYKDTWSRALSAQSDGGKAFMSAWLAVVCARTKYAQRILPYLTDGKVIGYLDES